MFERPRLSVLAVAVAVVAAAGCSANGPTGPGPLIVSFAGLAIGDQISLGTVDATLRFKDVLGDSRCPEDATCVWEGNARVALALVEASGRVTLFNLDTSPNGPDAQLRFVYRGLEISIARLLLATRTDRVINPGEYRLDVATRG